jgi:tetratricopeptide (TPR) repeat protein
MKIKTILFFISISFISGVSIFSQVDLIQKGLQLNKEGKIDSAIFYFNKAEKINPGNNQLYFYIGNSYFDLENYSKAIENYTKAIELKNSDLNSYYNRASAYSLLNKIDQAIADYDYIISIEKTNENAFFERGILLKKSNKLDIALNDFISALSINPKFELAFFEIGNIYFKQAKYLNAIINYDKAIELDNTSVDFYFNRAICEYNLGFKEDACADFKNAQDLGDTEVKQYIDELCK